MAGSCLWALQQGVHTKLIADTTLVETLLGGVVGGDARIYDAVKDNQDHDYVVHGDANEERADTMGRAGKNATFAIECWSNYPGSKNVKQIADRIAAVLDGAALTVTGYEHIRTVHDRTIVQRQGGEGVISRWAAIWFTAFLREA